MTRNNGAQRFLLKRRRKRCMEDVALQNTMRQSSYNYFEQCVDTNARAFKRQRTLAEQLDALCLKQPTYSNESMCGTQEVDMEREKKTRDLTTTDMGAVVMSAPSDRASQNLMNFLVDGRGNVLYPMDKLLRECAAALHQSVDGMALDEVEGTEVVAYRPPETPAPHRSYLSFTPDELEAFAGQERLVRFLHRQGRATAREGYEPRFIPIQDQDEGEDLRRTPLEQRLEAEAMQSSDEEDDMPMKKVQPHGSGVITHQEWFLEDTDDSL